MAARWAVGAAAAARRRVSYRLGGSVLPRAVG